MFQKNIDLNSCLDAGLTVNGETMMWWLNQGQDARDSLTDPAPEKLPKVLNDFTNWYWKHYNERLNKSFEIYPWSHGATFDLPFLNLAFKAIKRRQPWKFRNARDTRTLFELAFNGNKASFEGFGTKHNALHDSLSQVIWVQEAYRVLGKNQDQRNA